jgi:hypothetical protein
MLVTIAACHTTALGPVISWRKIILPYCVSYFDFFLEYLGVDILLDYWSQVMEYL